MKMTLNSEIFPDNVTLCRKFEVRLKCPNPLFEKWLEEWQLEAAARGLDIQHTFRKALVSLRKFPTSLKNGRQCMILENFGPKLCQKLDDKLIQHRLQYPNGGKEVLKKRAKSPEIVINVSKKYSRTKKAKDDYYAGVFDAEAKVLPSENAQVAEKIVDGCINSVENVESGNSERQVPKLVELNEITDNQSAVSWYEDVWKDTEFQPNESIEIVSNNNNDNDTRPPIKIKICIDRNKSATSNVGAQQSKLKKEYVPNKGSGAYALLITLHDHSCRYGCNVGMSKKLLKEEAQSLCDVPFDQHMPGSHYTAWSAMGQLCKKALVVKESNPARYILTKAGIELAEKLKTTTAESNSINDSINLASTDKSVNSNNDFVSNREASPPNSSMNNDSFSDINNAITSQVLDDEHCDFLADIDLKSSKYKRKRGSLLRSLYSSKVHTFSSSENEGESEGDCINDEFIPKKRNNKLINDIVYKALKKSFEDVNLKLDPTHNRLKSKGKPSCTIVRPPEEQDGNVCERKIDLNEKLVSHLDIENKNMYGFATEIFGKVSDSTSSKPNSQKCMGTSNRINVNDFVKEFCQKNSQGTSKGRNNYEEDMFGVLSQKDITIKPPSPVKSQNSTKTSQSSATSSQEDIEMLPMNYHVVLLADTAEKGKLGPEATRNNFEKMDINCEIRHLNVGDYTWICRDKFGNELILPFIAERKRLDDFSKSIKDGRFHEQKVRLKSACVKQRIYIVESYGNGHTGGLPLSTLMQAATNTQLIDGFVVKFTRNYNHTLKYLATLTHKFIHLINGKILRTSFGNELPPFSWNNNVFQLMTFDDFMRNANKKRKFNVREMFVRHLMLLHGVSVEKARTIVDKYPCPRLLIETYQSGMGDKNLLTKMKENKPLARCLGPVISKNIYDLYSNEKFN